VIGEEKHLFIRADAGSGMGIGHLMRCFALGQAWKDAGGKVVFVTACKSEGLLQRLRDEGFDLYMLASQYPDPGDWANTKDILADHPDVWFVLDGYHFDEVYQQWVKETGHRLLVIDDMAHLKHYYADIVLNQNLHAERLQYSCEAHTNLLLGTQYVLLKREFLAWRGWKREIPEIARRVLVTMGGGDPENHTLKVIQALQKVEVAGLEATVVIGAGEPHTDMLEASIRQSRVSIRLIFDAKNMPELMVWADIAVSNAGSTIWELLFLGTPTLALILADNQQCVAEQIEFQGLGKNLGRAENVSSESLAREIELLLKDSDFRTKISDRARRIVDEKGTQRVINLMRRESNNKLRLRPASSEDCHLLWQWSNDPVIRAASFNTKLITWEEHVEWFNSKLHDPVWYCYVVLNERGLPIGQIRADTMGNEAEISINISSGFRGQGYGSEAIRLASAWLFRDTSVNRIYANIKQGNIASIRAFRRASYKERGITFIKGHQALQMTLDINDGLSINGNCQNQ